MIAPGPHTRVYLVLGAATRLLNNERRETWETGGALSVSPCPQASLFPQVSGITVNNASTFPVTDVRFPRNRGDSPVTATSTSFAFAATRTRTCLAGLFMTVLALLAFPLPGRCDDPLARCDASATLGYCREYGQG